MNRTAGRLTLMLAALALLAGCEATRFERAPLAASEPCDRALVGSWQDEPDAVGEVTRLQVSADCRLVVTMIHEGKGNSTDPVRLSTARLGDRDFAWVSARWAHEHFVDGGPLVGPDEVYVVHYRLRDGGLQVFGPANITVADLVKRGELRGKVTEDETDTFVRIDAAGGRQALEHPRFFRDTPRSFRKGAPN